jgi:hypothetical protein
MIMTRLSMLVGVVLTLSVGVAATVVGQTLADPTKRSGDSTTTYTAVFVPAAGAAPIFEYEIRIWKDGAPVTPTMKMRAHPGETSQLKLPEGTVGLSFQPRKESTEARGVAPGPGGPAGATQPTSSTSDESLFAQAISADVPKIAQAEELLRLRSALERGVKKPADSSLPEALLGLAQKPATGESQDHESRLAAIERKLERILSVLDRVPQKESNRNPAARP